MSVLLWFVTFMLCLSRFFIILIGMSIKTNTIHFQNNNMQISVIIIAMIDC